MSPTRWCPQSVLADRKVPSARKVTGYPLDLGEGLAVSPASQLWL